MSTIKELWLPIKGYEGLYEVSNNGDVRSIDRIIEDDRCNRFFVGKILSKTKHNGKQPYYYVTLSKCGKNKKQFVHRLVAETFIENPFCLPQVNHIDGNVHNNNVSNLEWVTNAQNTQHAYDNFLNVKHQLHIEYRGEVHSLRKWCKILNLPYKTIWFRYHNGWSIEECFNGKRVMPNVKG